MKIVIPTNSSMIHELSELPFGYLTELWKIKMFDR